MKKVKWRLTKGSAALLLFWVLSFGAEGVVALDGTQKAEVLPVISRYLEEWNPEGLGNYRAVVKAEEAAEVIWARIAWRRIDPMPEYKGIVVTFSKNGAPVENVFAPTVSPEYGDVFFEAKEPGEYYVYYMPYREVKREWNPFPEYFETEQSSPLWLAKVESIALEVLRGDIPKNVIRAATLRLESNGKSNSFCEMEIPATVEEKESFLSSHEERSIVFFQEPVSSPIRKGDKMPVHWVHSGPQAECRASGTAGELLFFQLGALATKKDLIHLQMGCIGLQDSLGRLIRDLAPHCFNFGGIDFQGNPLIKDVLLKKSEVIPLWFSVRIPEDTQTGTYKGELIFSADNLRHTPLPFILEVTEKRNDSGEELANASLERLIWLNSEAGLNGNPLEKYPEITTEGNVLQVNNHSLVVASNGLPAQVSDVLFASPMEFGVKLKDGDWLQWTNLPVLYNQDNNCLMNWESISYAKGIVLHSYAELEADGMMAMRFELSSKRDFDLEDVQLSFRFREESVPYFMGMGCRGGKRPDYLDWKWGKNANSFFWIGDVSQGLYCKLLDIGERQDIYFMPEPYRDWCGDGGEGKVELRPLADHLSLEVHTGKMLLTAGEDRVFRLNMMLTPFGKPDMKISSQKVYAAGIGKFLNDPNGGEDADRVVVGYDEKLNPYLNYPFASEESLKEVMEKLHGAGKKAQFVIGTREIPYQINEFWPLWSLDNEIFTYGIGLKGVHKEHGFGYARVPIPFIGNPWLCEHLGEGYSASWRSMNAEGEEIVTLGINPLSRWQNFYLETVRNLSDHLQVDGIRTDLTDRRITKRLRSLLDEICPNGFLDTITGNNFRPENGMINPMGQYLESLPLLDSIVFADGFSYGAGPDYYLVELSGVPFGVNASFYTDMPFKSLLYGTLPQMRKEDKGLENLWKFCDSFGLEESTFTGYWESPFPLEIEDKDILASVYKKGSQALIVVVHWGSLNWSLTLGSKDMKRLGLDPERSLIGMPEIPGLQTGSKFSSIVTHTLAPGEGALFLIQEKR